MSSKDSHTSSKQKPTIASASSLEAGSASNNLGFIQYAPHHVFSYPSSNPMLQQPSIATFPQTERKIIQSDIIPHVPYAIPNILTTTNALEQNVPSKAKSRKSNSQIRGNLPKKAVNALKRWLFDHFTNPYPTEDEKMKLATETGLNMTQVNNWFINSRRRIWKPLIYKTSQQQQEAIRQELAKDEEEEDEEVPSRKEAKIEKTADLSNIVGDSETDEPAVKPQHEYLDTFKALEALKVDVPDTFNAMAVKPEAITSAAQLGLELLNEKVRNKKKRTYHQMIVEDAYQIELEEYMRLKRENELLKIERRRVLQQTSAMEHDFGLRNAKLEEYMAELRTKYEDLRARHQTYVDELFSKRRAFALSKLEKDQQNLKQEDRIIIPVASKFTIERSSEVSRKHEVFRKTEPLNELEYEVALSLNQLAVDNKL